FADRGERATVDTLDISAPAVGHHLRSIALRTRDAVVVGLPQDQVVTAGRAHERLEPAVVALVNRPERAPIAVRCDRAAIHVSGLRVRDSAVDQAHTTQIASDGSQVARSLIPTA